MISFNPKFGEFIAFSDWRSGRLHDATFSTRSKGQRDG
jgi:hypothetical protein